MLVDFKVDQKSCEERGCIWDSQKRTDDIPVCYLDPKKIGYKKVNDVKQSADGLKADLLIKDSAQAIFKNTNQIKSLRIEFTYITDTILRFKVIDPKNARYEVPFQKNFPLLQKSMKTDEKDRIYSIDFSDSKDDFSFSISRKSTKTKL